MGDFNQLNLKLSAHYKQVVTKPTRRSKILDKCYTNMKDGYGRCMQLPPLASGQAESDHNIIHLIPNYKPLSHSNKRQVVSRKFTDENVDNLRACFSTTDWGVMLEDRQCAEEKVEMFTDYVNFCTDTLIPTKTVTIEPNSKPWINNKIKKMIDEKMHYHNRNRKRFNLLKNQISREIYRSKRNYFQRVQENMAENPRNAWADLKKLGGIPSKKDQKSAQPIKLDPNDLNSFYARFEKNTPIQPVEPSGSCNDKVSFGEITALTVCKQLKRLDTRKSPGPDKLIPNVLKKCADELCDIISSLFNLLIQEGITPKQWKVAKIKPIPKIPQPMICKDYRPIAITSHMCKVLERIVKQYIMNNSNIDPLQFAYQARKSTQDAAMCLLVNITRHIDKANTNYVRALFLDFSSAFNTINVNLLIDKIQHLDVSIVRWVQSFLTDRKSYTATGANNVSSMITTQTGMPQGTVLSPVLFILYTDSLRSTTEKAAVIKYADDTVLLGFVSNDADNLLYFDQVQQMSDYCNQSDLLLNHTKTHEMIFTTKKTKPIVPALHIDNKEIATSDEVKYLGLHIDSNLRFTKQADIMISSASKRMYVLRRFSALGANDKLVTQLYKSFIESRFLYCIILFFDHMYSNQRSEMRSIVKEAKHKGVCIENTLDEIIEKRCKNYVLRSFQDDEHIIHSFLDRLPSGRLRNHKVRSNIGQVCFYTKMIKIINKNVF